MITRPLWLPCRRGFELPGNLTARVIPHPEVSPLWTRSLSDLAQAVVESARGARPPDLTFLRPLPELVVEGEPRCRALQEWLTERDLPPRPDARAWQWRFDGEQETLMFNGSVSGQLVLRVAPGTPASHLRVTVGFLLPESHVTAVTAIAGVVGSQQGAKPAALVFTNALPSAIRVWSASDLEGVATTALHPAARRRWRFLRRQSGESVKCVPGFLWDGLRDPLPPEAVGNRWSVIAGRALEQMNRLEGDGAPDRTSELRVDSLDMDRFWRLAAGRAGERLPEQLICGPSEAGGDELRGRLVQALRDFDRTVLEMREDDPDISQAGIAERLGTTRDRVRLSLARIQAVTKKLLKN